jgi:hypothetical protein
MRARTMSLAQRISGNKFILKRSILKLVGGEYFIYDGSAAGLLLYAHQKGFKLKEEITIYGDASKSEPLMMITARSIIDFSAAYDIVDLTTNERVGVLQRKGFNSIIRDEWIILNGAEQQIGTLFEDSMAMALLRRFLSNLIPQNYDMLFGTNRVADFRQNFNPFSYQLNIEVLGPVDTRLVIAASVLLAAIEGRQRN